MARDINYFTKISGKIAEEDINEDDRCLDEKITGEYHTFQPYFAGRQNVRIVLVEGFTEEDEFSGIEDGEEDK